MHDVLYYYSISIFYYSKVIKERSKKSAWCPPSSQTCPQATSWYFSSLLAIDHRMTSFSWCFHLHAKKNKQPCLEIINYSKYLQYFEGQINKVFSTIRVGLLVAWWVKKSSLKTFTVVYKGFCGQILRKKSEYLLLWVFRKIAWVIFPKDLS